MAQPHAVARGVLPGSSCGEPARRRTRTRAAPGGRNSRIDELFAEESAPATKRPVAKESAAKQPAALTATVLAEPPPPADARGSTTAVGVQAAASFFAVGLVWQLWPLLALGWRSTVGRWRWKPRRAAAARPKASAHAEPSATSPLKPPPPPPVGRTTPGWGLLSKEQAASVREATRAKFPGVAPKLFPQRASPPGDDDAERPASQKGQGKGAASRAAWGDDGESEPQQAVPLPPPPPRRFTPPQQQQQQQKPTPPPPAAARPPQPPPPPVSTANLQQGNDPWTDAPAAAAAPPPDERLAFGPAVPPPPDAAPLAPLSSPAEPGDKHAKLREAAAAVPGTQVFLADDAAASALTAKRKWWHTAQQLWVIRIADEGGEGGDEAVNLAMFYLFDAPPALLAFEAQDDAARCRWLMRAIGFAAQDVVPMPTQTIRESLQGAGGVTVLAVRAGELELSPARDLDEFAARLQGLDGVREEFVAQQLQQALQQQQGGTQ